MHKNGHTHGYEWERCRRVKERIAELCAENERKSQMTRAELMTFYASFLTQTRWAMIALRLPGGESTHCATQLRWSPGSQ